MRLVLNNEGTIIKVKEGVMADEDRQYLDGMAGDDGDEDGEEDEE